MKTSQTRLWMVGSGLVAASAIAMLSQTAATARQKGQGIAWKTSMQQAQQEAKRTGKPILVEFHATWCAVCKQLAAQTLSKPAVVRESQKWVPVQVDVDKAPQLARKYLVSSTPTVAFVRPDGSLYGGFVGFLDSGEMVRGMRAAYAKTKKPAQVASAPRGLVQPVGAAASCCAP